MSNRKVRARLFVGLVTLLCSSVVRYARADLARRPALHWSRGEGATSCIDPRTLAERVEALTGPVLVAPTESDLSIEGHVEARTQGGFRARITVARKTGAPVGDRVLEEASPNCRALDAALAFVIALTIDPTLTLPPGLVATDASGDAPEESLLADLNSKPARPAPVFGPIVVPLAKPVAPPRKPASAAARKRWETGMAALFSANELPHLAWGAAIFGTYRVRWFGFTLQARAASAREALRVDDVRSARTQVFGAAALACPRIIALWRIRLDGCLGPELSFLRAHGIGFSTPKDALLTQYTGLFGLTANLPLLGDLALDLRAFGHLNFNRVGLNYTLLGETREVFTTPRLAFWATTGLSYAF